VKARPAIIPGRPPNNESNCQHQTYNTDKHLSDEITLPLPELALPAATGSSRCPFENRDVNIAGFSSLWLVGSIVGRVSLPGLGGYIIAVPDHHLVHISPEHNLAQ